MSDSWNLVQVGRAASATTPVGRVPQYGLAYDLGTAQWQSAEQFQQAMRDFARKQAAAQLQMVQAQQEARARELELATNFQTSGLALSNDQLAQVQAAAAAHHGDSSFGSDFLKIPGDIMGALHVLKSGAGQYASALYEDPTNAFRVHAKTDNPTYGDYKDAGGILNQDQFESFDLETQQYLLNRAHLNTTVSDVVETPGIKHVLVGLNAAYRGAEVPFNMVAKAGHRDPLMNLIDPMWFQKGAYGAAWREAQGQSLGNAITNSVLAPYVPADRLDDWRKNNSLYQLTSLGVEVGATWYADAGVAAGKTAGGITRLVRNEMPLKETGALYKGTAQALQREQITVSTPLRLQAQWRAKRINNAWDDVEAYAKDHTYADFSQLPMFRKRDLDGQSAAAALHWAFREGTPEQIDLTRQLLHGDPKAYQTFEGLKKAAPEELAKFSDGAQTFIDAIEATKTKIPLLERQAEDLMKTEPKSPFHEWSLHVEADAKLRDVQEAQDALNKYAGYRGWMDSLSRAPKVERVGAPKNRFFMDNQFGFSHKVVEWTRPLWIQRANSIEMHDIDSGAESIRRQFEQFNHLWKYENPEALDKALQDWHDAPTSFDRYLVALGVEETHLIDAAAQHFGVAHDTIRGIYQKVVSEQNKMVNALQRGDGAIYSAAPDLAGRLAEGESGVKLVSRNEDEGLVTLELMDGNRRTTVTVPDHALVPKNRPIDPTQTPNYYQPLDTRQFHLALKRNEDLITLLDQAGWRHGTAAGMQLIDNLGVKFNALWKPLQLFRLGWPQRVLMDEQMRAMAVLGIDGFISNYGSDTLRAFNNAGVKMIDASRNAVNMLVHSPLFRERFNTGNRVTIGPGPVAEATKRTMDPFRRDTELIEAPKVPESFVPVLDNARYAKVAGVVAEHERYNRALNKYLAWQRSVNIRKTPDLLYADVNNLTPLQERLFDNVRGGFHHPGLRPAHPLFKALQHWDSEIWDTPAGRWAAYGEAASRGPRLYDPITGNAVKSGFAVPLWHTRSHLAYEGSGEARTMDALSHWYAQHRELLASRGYRVMVDTQGHVYVARWFNGNERRRAQDFMQFVESPMHDIGRKTTYVAKDYNDLSPTTEAAYRQFVSKRPFERQTGDAPYGGPKRLEGNPTVLHGTTGQLPEDLLPRESAPMDTGRMVGEGFYTTVKQDVAEGFGNNLYTIKGSKDGRKYRIFDMDKTPSGNDLKRLRRFLKNPPVDHPHIRDWEGAAARVEHVFNLDHQFVYRYYSHLSGPPSWLDYMTHLSMEGTEAQRILTKFLEDVHGAGALTHMGGGVSGNANRVYVWLDPENLLVRPLYAQSDRYVPMIEWLSNPLSKEVPIPENRIVRTGVRNPLFQELHQNHALLEQRRSQLKGKAKFGDPEVRSRLTREQDIMGQLGLDYARAGRPEEPHPNLGQDWYVQHDPGRYERMVDAAHAEQATRDAAAAANGELRHHEVGVDSTGDPDLDFDFQLDSVHSRVYRAVIKRRESGHGYKQITSADGKSFQVRNAYEGHDGELMRSLISSQGAIEALSDGHGAALSLLRRQAQGHKTYHPPVMNAAARTAGTPENRAAVEYFHRWSDLVNNQIAHSPIWNKMLNGWSDEKIVHWLNTTPEGAVVKREVMHEGRQPELWVNEHRAKLDYYLPSKKLQRNLSKGRLEASQLRREIPDHQLPDVFGPDVEFLSKQEGAGKALGWIMDRIWYGLGTVPADVLSRHPFARSMYDLKLKSLIQSTDSKWLDQATLDRFEKQSRNYAREQVRKTLWDLSDSTNFTDALRFVAPFWGAQQEAIVKWGKIVSDRPETVARMFNLQRGVYNNFAVVDQDGQPAKRDYFSYHPTDRVIVRIPNVMRHTALGKALETIGSVGVPLGSANTILQGETPLLPGPGPVLTIPADKFMRATSDIYGTQYDDKFLYRWLFPVGRPQHGGIKGVLDQLLPGWGKRVVALNEGDGGIAYANLYTEVAREMELANQKKGIKPPTPAEIEQQARWVWGLRIVAGLVSPVQTQFRPKHQFLIDAAHKYQRDYGQEWFDKFMADYGTSMARYATSSSNSLISIPPTSQGMEDWAQNKTLIAQYPQWGGAIIAPDAYTDDFSSDAYYAQFQINLGPGDSRTLREPQSTQQRFAEADARAGWYEFRKVQSIIDSELAKRGLHSITQTGAEDLAAMKRNFVSDLSKRLPAWRDEYDSFANDIYTRVGELEKFAFNPEFDNRPDFQGVRQYLMLRDQVGAELDRYAAQTGGSRSLQAQENTALRNWFYDQVGQLTQANPAFAEFYNRYLTQDTLQQGSGN